MVATFSSGMLPPDNMLILYGIIAFLTIILIAIPALYIFSCTIRLRVCFKNYSKGITRAIILATAIILLNYSTVLITYSLWQHRCNPDWLYEKALIEAFTKTISQFLMPSIVAIVLWLIVHFLLLSSKERNDA